MKNYRGAIPETSRPRNKEGIPLSRIPAEPSPPNITGGILEQSCGRTRVLSESSRPSDLNWDWRGSIADEHDSGDSMRDQRWTGDVPRLIPLLNGAIILCSDYRLFGCAPALKVWYGSIGYVGFGLNCVVSREHVQAEQREAGARWNRR